MESRNKQAFFLPSVAPLWLDPTFVYVPFTSVRVLRKETGKRKTGNVPMECEVETNTIKAVIRKARSY